MKRATAWIVLAVFLATVTGCIGIQGGNDPGKTEPTFGQQLIDLKKAKDQGAITQEEYVACKEKLKRFYE